MLTLCGFGASNYHNKVKLVLLEKGVAFEEELAWVGETDPAASPRREVDAGLYALSLRLTHTPRSPHERYLSFRIWKIRTWL